MMAEKYASVSPYNFSFNDPVGMNDPSGADPDYLETQYAYDGGYKGHRIMYDDVYFGKDLGMPVINAGGSWQVMDPGNHITPGSGGNWSDNPVYSNEYWAFPPVSRDGNNLTINWNQTGSHGGTWDPNNGYHPFVNDTEAFIAGASYNFRHDSWNHTKLYQDLEKEKSNSEEERANIPLVASSDPNLSSEDIVMDHIAQDINENGLSSFADWIKSIVVGPKFFISSIEGWKTNNSEKWWVPSKLSFALKAASWGHHYFPDPDYDTNRHVIGTFLFAEKYGFSAARDYTNLNEIYGFLAHDLGDLKARINGTRPWALQFSDVVANTKGLILWMEYNKWKNGQENDF